MRLPEFCRMFPKETRIGSYIRDGQYFKWYDNGERVGMWRYDLQTGESAGGIRGEAEAVAEMAMFGGRGR